MPRFELVEGTSSKFWEIVLEGSSFTTRYGRIGTTGQSTTKSFPSAAKAGAEYEKLIAEKTKKGYQLVGDPPPVAAPAPAPAAATGVTARLAELLIPLGSHRLTRSEGNDDLVTFTWSGAGVPTLADILTQRGFLTTQKPDQLVQGMMDQLKHYSYTTEQRQTYESTWKRLLDTLAQRAQQIEFLDLRIFVESASKTWDDRFPLFVLQDSRGYWTAVGPEIENSRHQREYGGPLLVPNDVGVEGKIFDDFYAPPFAFMKGQENGSVGKPAYYTCKQSRGAAIDGLLRSIRALRSFKFETFDREEEDEHVTALTRYLLDELQSTQVHVLGVFSNFDHFVFGRLDERTWIGFWTNAGWT